MLELSYIFIIIIIIITIFFLNLAWIFIIKIRK
jgi:hypothetical protein